MSPFQFDLHHLIFQCVLEAEAELLTHLLHPLVFDKNVPGEMIISSFSLHHMWRTRFPFCSSEVYVFPSLLVSCMEQRDYDCGRTDGSRPGKKHVLVQLVS